MEKGLSLQIKKKDNITLNMEKELILRNHSKNTMIKMEKGFSLQIKKKNTIMIDMEKCLILLNNPKNIILLMEKGLNFQIKNKNNYIIKTEIIRKYHKKYITNMEKGFSIRIKTILKWKNSKYIQLKLFKLK